MLKNYLRTAWRNLKRNKTYAIINILGLSVGIAACVLIFLVVQFETSFDNFHAKKESIYRIGSKFKTQDGVGYSDGTAFPTGPALKLDFPQVKHVARIYKNRGDQITLLSGGSNDKKFTEDFYFAEPEFFKIFDFEWVVGNPKTALTEPQSIAITEKIAEKYFGSVKEAMGKTLKRNNNNKQVYKVNGILKNIPANSDFPFTIVASYASLQNTSVASNLNDWVSTYGSAYTFVTLPPELSKEKFDKALVGFAKKHKPAEYANDAYVAQPLKDIHYNEEFGNYRDHTFSKSLVTALSLIAIFLIVIACVNFVNLATAQAVNRSKEVGVRKVLGSSRAQLAFQFLGETAIIIVFAVLIAVVIAAFTLPFLNQLLRVEISMNILKNPAILGMLAIIVVSVTLLSGLYPAMILAGFNPITALKSKFSQKMVGGLSLRRGLVVMQFAIAQALIIGTIIVLNQMSFFRNASLGFDKAAVVNVPVPGDSISETKFEYLRNKLQQNPDISDISFSYASPSANGNWNSDFKYDNSDKNTDFSANLKWADPDYFKTYKIQFVAGRPYYESDTVREFVVNETLLKKLGIRDPKEALGKKLNFWDGEIVAQIVGVIRDFNSYSLRQPMAPVVLSTWKRVYQVINVRIKPGKEKATLAFIENLWKGTYPDYIYSYSFLDET
ncbi:MAG TPA: ABC transporter permease, partial [Chitinophagaceae bacterium]|nr:ABC transporter permease [Chitinophagaceae bacterium]